MDEKAKALPRANTLNPTRRFAVRLSLAAGATVATLLGAQALALREQPAADVAASDTGSASDTSNISVPINPLLAPAAPQLVVIRHAGAGSPAASAGTVPYDIVPPQPAFAPAAPADVPPPQPQAQPQQPQQAQQPQPQQQQQQQHSAPAVHAAPPQPAPHTSSSHK